MIKVTVHYGNHNKYSIDLPENTKLGYLSWYLTRIIDMKAEDVLYLIMGGMLVGSKAAPFTSLLGDCNMVNNECVVSMVLRDSSISYPDSDLYLLERNKRWLRRQGSNRTDAPDTGSLAPVSNIQQLLQVFGVDMNNLVDVPVTVPESEYEQHITQLTSVTNPCSICSNVIDEDGVALSCGHEFHDSCIREWLTTESVRCPSCNHDVRTDNSQ